MLMIKYWVRKVNNSFVRAGKSRNIYKMDRETYEKLLHENIKRTCKKTDRNKVRTININAKKSRTIKT